MENMVTSQPPITVLEASPASPSCEAASADAAARLNLQQLMVLGGVLLAVMNVVSWIAWQYPFASELDRSGTPIGGDFPMFYLAGKAVLQKTPERLYSLQDNHEDLHQLFPQLAKNSVLPYRYPPFVASLMAPLAALPYRAAFAIWIVLQLGMLLLALGIAQRELAIFQSEWRKAMLAVSIGFPLVWEAIFGGQASLLAVAIVVASECLVRRKQVFAAGLLWGLAAYKPPVLLFVGLAQLIRYPRMFWGVVTSVSVLVGLSLVCCGPAAMADYLEITLQLSGTSPWNVPTPVEKVHGLVEWAQVLSPRFGKAIVVGLGMLASVAIGLWLRHEASKQGPSAGNLSKDTLPDFGIALLLVIQSLANPYLPIYDLALLLPALWYGASALLTALGPLKESQVRSASLTLLGLLLGPHLCQAICRAGMPKPYSLSLLLVGIWLAVQMWR